MLLLITLLVGPYAEAEHGDRTEADPLGATASMRRWATRQIRRQPDARRLESLHRALLARGWRHRDDLTLTAVEAFTRREGDCVSFALLLVALARSVEVEAVFSIGRAVTSTRHGGMEIARGHLGVSPGGGSSGRPSLLFDAAGLGRAPPGFRPIPDRQAVAIFHSNRGAEHLLAGDWRAAERALEAATEADAELPEAWSNLGVARSRLDDWDGAEQAYWRAITLAPDSAAGWRNLALLLQRRLGRRPAAPSRGDPPR